MGLIKQLFLYAHDDDDNDDYVFDNHNEWNKFVVVEGKKVIYFNRNCIGLNKRI